MKINMIFIILLEIPQIFSQAQTNYSSLSTLNTSQHKTEIVNDNMPLLKEYEESLYLEETIDPNIYIVGPGDKFSFNMVGTDGVITLPLIVSPIGDVLITAVGVVNVDKLTLNDAFNRIKESCLLLYPNSKVNITLVTIRKFKVKVLGILNTQGFVNVSPISRISDIYQEIRSSALKIYNEIENADSIDISSRNIKLLRDNQEIRVDLIKYSMFGDDNDNPFLQQGDIVKISIKEKEVGLYGGVILPGKYELVEQETVYDLIKLSGGFTKNADISKIELTRFINDTDKVNIVLSNSEDYKQTILKDEDFIKVRYKKEYKRQDLVNITGEVHYPGTYSIMEGETTIDNLLTKTGGYTKKADLSKIIINNNSIASIADIELQRISLIPNVERSYEENAYLKARARVNKGSINSVDSNFTHFIKQFKISRGDSIHIPSVYSFIEVLGAVYHPGRFPFLPDYDYDDYIDLAGGVANNATRKRYIIKSNTGQRFEFSKQMSIENGDIIFIAEKLEYTRWERYREIMATLGQAATIIAVIQSAINK